MAVIIDDLLIALSVNFLTNMGTKAVKNLFSGDELKSVSERAFIDFRESCIESGDKREDDVLLEVFREFFTDDRSVNEFKQVFNARSDRVDVNLLKEIFEDVCAKRGIKIPTFNFFLAVSHIIGRMEELAGKEEKFRESFQMKHLEKIQTHLQKRGAELNVTIARFKYLTQLIYHNRRLQWGGIPDPREKKDIELPSIFVMQRARESLPEDDYKRLVHERGGDEDFTGEEDPVPKDPIIMS